MDGIYAMGAGSLPFMADFSAKTSLIRRGLVVQRRGGDLKREYTLEKIIGPNSSYAITLSNLNEFWSEKSLSPSVLAIPVPPLFIIRCSYLADCYTVAVSLK